jgi:hypothetical protein
MRTPSFPKARNHYQYEESHPVSKARATAVNALVGDVLEAIMEKGDEHGFAIECSATYHPDHDASGTYNPIVTIWLMDVRPTKGDVTA